MEAEVHFWPSSETDLFLRSKSGFLLGFRRVRALVIGDTLLCNSCDCAVVLEDINQ